MRRLPRAAVARVGPDAIAALVLFGAAFGAGTWYVRHAIASGARPQFYQAHYGPAAMWACGYGYVSPVHGTVPTLDEFLALRRDRFSCAEVHGAPPAGPLTGPQVTWRYLLLAAAAVWRVTGVSWPGLVPLSGALFAATAALCYLLVRSVAHPLIAAVTAVLVVSSPLHLAQLPELRDYAKTPFMMAAWLVLAALVSSSRTPAGVLGLSALFGAIIAIGSGFRNDLLIVAPTLLIVLALLPGKPWSNLGLKVSAAGVAFLAFVLAARPLLGAYTEGGGASMQHVALLGLTSPFTGALGLTPAIYEFASPYDDSYISAVVRDFGARRMHITGRIHPYSQDYDRAAGALVREIAATMPGDLVTRAYASIGKTISLPVSNVADREPPQYVQDDSSLATLYRARAALLRMLARPWLMVVPVAAFVALVQNARVGLIVLLCVSYLTAYPAIQFDPRHYFPLNIVPLAAAAYLVQVGVGVARGAPKIGELLSPGRPVRAGSVAAVIAAAAAVVLLGARGWQRRAVVEDLASRAAAAVEPIRTVPAPDGSNTVIVAGLAAEGRARETAGVVGSAYLAVAIGPCAPSRAAVTMRYQGSEEFADFTQVIRAPTAREGETKILAPVFFQFLGDSWYRFDRIDFGDLAAGCVPRVFRVADSGRFPLLLTVALRPDWSADRLYQSYHWPGPSWLFPKS